MKALLLVLLLAGCASMSAEELADALSTTGRNISKHTRPAPSIDPISVSHIRPF